MSAVLLEGRVASRAVRPAGGRARRGLEVEVAVRRWYVGDEWRAADAGTTARVRVFEPESDDLADGLVPDRPVLVAGEVASSWLAGFADRGDLVVRARTIGRPLLD